MIEYDVSFFSFTPPMIFFSKSFSLGWIVLRTKIPKSRKIESGVCPHVLRMSCARVRASPPTFSLSDDRRRTNVCFFGWRIRSLAYWLLGCLHGSPQGLLLVFSLSSHGYILQLLSFLCCLDQHIPVTATVEEG